MTTFRALLTLLALAWTGAAPAQEAEFPIKGIDGTPVLNHRLTPAQAAEVAKLTAVAPAGNPNGDVTVYKFYDLNCPYCRRASQEVAAILKSDRSLKVVFVPYAVLSVGSIQGAMVELAIITLAPQRMPEFHRRIYAGRGRIDGDRALAVAKDMGFDLEKIVAIANDPRTPQALKSHAVLGGDLRLVATPAYVVRDVAIVGHPGQKSLQAVIGSVRRCGRVVC